MSERAANLVSGEFSGVRICLDTGRDIDPATHRREPQLPNPEVGPYQLHVNHVIRRTRTTEPMFGYALALMAWVRGEHSPAWAKYVRSGVRSELRQGLRFLNKHGITKLRPIAKPH